ncbi:hypothetical protein DAPPUDRAFT_249946 [Daphnia pulex]|uniref:Uncharacterized protein n=1 Tax=Daphnia pulex TaxID=6669 RepID=E9GXL5_DAPPU|nr:hypothetical protein DAPPUDRAFT_249946 [Daphnia pulex]|eukprot:EFX75678.1 hypothetical protein DAPPUDRAFT_249946 [Daphnia pulex]
MLNNSSSTLMAVLIFLLLAILDPQLRLISQSSCQASPRSVLAQSNTLSRVIRLLMLASAAVYKMAVQVL